MEQCSRCPSVAEEFTEEDCCCEMFDLIHEYQRRGELEHYSDANLAAVLFAPVKFIAMNRTCCNADLDEQLEELVQMLQRLLAVR